METEKVERPFAKEHAAKLRVQAELMVKQYHLIVEHLDMTREMKIGYLTAAAHVDERFDVGWATIDQLVTAFSEVFEQ